MQTRNLVISVGLAALAAGSALLAQNNYRGVANMPFDFQVTGRVLPAGEYVVTAAGNANVFVRDKATNHTVIVPARSVLSTGEEENPRLVFNRYGNKYFLAEIWLPNELSGRAVPRTKQEKEIARSNSTTGVLASIKISSK